MKIAYANLLRENEELKALCFKAGCSHVRPEYLKNLERVATEAEDLYDNRLGHRPDNPQWSAPQFFWKKLGESLQALRGKEIK